jgi:Sec-independent protein translocase protein TatA
MQIFNVGVLEILFILILAFVILGPRRTIKTAKDVGVWIRNLAKSPIWRDIVSATSEIRDLPKKLMDEAELQRMVEELDLSTQEIKQIISEAKRETETELSKLKGRLIRICPTIFLRMILPWMRPKNQIQSLSLANRSCCVKHGRL